MITTCTAMKRLSPHVLGGGREGGREGGKGRKEGGREGGREGREGGRGSGTERRKGNLNCECLNPCIGLIPLLWGSLRLAPIQALLGSPQYRLSQARPNTGSLRLIPIRYCIYSNFLRFQSFEEVCFSYVSIK